MTIYLPEAKVHRANEVCNNAVPQPQMSGRQQASLLGTLESCRLAIWVAALHLRALQILLIKTLRDHQFDYYLIPSLEQSQPGAWQIYPRSTAVLFLPNHPISQFYQMPQCKIGVPQVKADGLVRNQSSTSTF